MTTDTTVLSDNDLIAYCGDNAGRWATAFRQRALKLGYSDMDVGWLIGWFANAIVRAQDETKRRLVRGTGLSDAFLASGGIGRMLSLLKAAESAIQQHYRDYDGETEDLLGLLTVRGSIRALLAELPGAEPEKADG